MHKFRTVRFVENALRMEENGNSHIICLKSVEESVDKITPRSGVIPEKLTGVQPVGNCQHLMEPEGLYAQPDHKVSVRSFVKCFVSARSCWNLAKLPRWRTTPCWLSANAYSVYSQLSFLSVGRSFIGNLRTRHAVMTAASVVENVVLKPTLNKSSDSLSRSNLAPTAKVYQYLAILVINILIT